MNTAELVSTALTLAVIFNSNLTAAPASPILDKQKLLDAETWWDNRDWDWYKTNIPFFECPDADINTTYYYRWELTTKHVTYGSPNSGYSYTEFIDRPFWSGAYGAISCPVGHQLYEVRWLRDPRYARDYSRYWFRTPGAEPRKYGCWLVDGLWSVHEIHPNDAFIKDLLPDMVRNFEGWEKRQWVPEVGLFWQNGHDDGMEYNINSRQTKDILRGANGYRPGFNAYMWADALAIARVARLAGDESTAKTYDAKAGAIKEKLQKLLWDPKREFFFPMSMRDEVDKDGHVVKKHTLTYQSGQFAGSPHGRELHAYIPWQFNLPDRGFESAWKFLMDRDYFYADYGPTTVERGDPLFVLKKTCCWWSGQSWPYGTAQTLKALANLLQNYDQKFITRADYLKLLQIYSRTHRKNGKPYLAEACHPDTGSFEGHDGYNHSEHYFHSSYNDLIITGLIGLKPRSDNIIEIDPLAPADWDFFAIDDLPYRGFNVSIIWDKNGQRYGRGAGLQIFADGKVVGSSKTIAKLNASLPAAPQASTSKAVPHNYAVNNDGDYYPRLAASYTASRTALSKVNDGNYWYTIHPPNRWTTAGSSNTTDWLSINFGAPRSIHTVKLFLLDDGTNIVSPRSVDLQALEGGEWKTISNQRVTFSRLEGHKPNVIQFAARDVTQLRAVFTHAAEGRTGLTEIEAWGDGTLPYTPAPPPAGNVALNLKGDSYPAATASFSDVYGGIPSKAIDGRINFLPTPVNRWTAYGSPNSNDWLQVDFGASKEVGRVDLYIYDDRGGVQPPLAYNVQFFTGNEWRDAEDQKRTPAVPVGNAVNTVTFRKIAASKLRVIFTHNGKSRSGVTELEIWRN